MAIVDRSTVKLLLGITDTLSDRKIDSLIPLVEQNYLDIRKAPWDVKNGEIVYPIGSDITAAEMIGYKLAAKSNPDLQSETIGSYSYSKSSSSKFMGYPIDIVGAIKKYIVGA